MNNSELFNTLINAIEAGDIRTVQQALGIGELNFPLDEKINLATDKEPLLYLTDQSGDTLLTTAARLQKHSIVNLLIHCGSDLNHENQQQDRAVDLAWYHENYATVLLLLKNDSKFPSDFDLAELGSTESDLEEVDLDNLTAEDLEIMPVANRLLSRFAKQRALLHTTIKNDDLTEIKRLLLKEEPAKFYFNQQGRSALATAVENNIPEIYAYLKSIGAELMGAQEMNLLDISLDSVKKNNFRRALLPYFQSVNDYLILYLQSKTRTTTTDKDYFSIIYNYYKKLSEIQEIKKILEVLYYADTLNIVFDFERSSVDRMTLGDYSDAVGLTIPREGTIYIAANQDEKFVLGTIAHEFAHYALQLLYHNNAESHEESDISRKQQLIDIVNRIKMNPQNTNNEVTKLIDTILQAYPENSQPAEFSALVPEILAILNNENDIHQAVNIIPELFNYYNGKILVDCENFVDHANLIKNKNNIRLLNSYTRDLDEIQDISVKFYPDHTYDSFLNDIIPPSKQSKNIILVKSYSLKLSSSHIYQSIKNSKYYKFKNSYLWISSANFKHLKNEILQVFNVGESGLLVISNPVGIDQELKDLLDIVSVYPNKKLLLIGNIEQVDSVSRLLARKLTSGNYLEIEEPPLTVDKLTVSSREKLFSHPISLQGNTITIRELLNIKMNNQADTLKLIEVAPLFDLINLKSRLGKPISTLSNRYYHHRNFNYKPVILWSILDSVHSSKLLLAISGNHASTQVSQFTNQ